MYRKEQINNMYRAVEGLSNIFSEILHPSFGARFERDESILFLYLGENGPQNMTSIAAYLTLPLSSSHALVSKLIKKGVVVRSTPESDRRIIRVSLTDEWLEHYKKYVEMKDRLARQIYRWLGDRDIQAIIRVEKKFRKAMAAMQINLNKQ